MDAAGKTPAETTVAPRSDLAAILTDIDRHQRKTGAPELSDDDATALAVQETRTARARRRHDRTIPRAS